VPSRHQAPFEDIHRKIRSNIPAHSTALMEMPQRKPLVSLVRAWFRSQECRSGSWNAMATLPASHYAYAG
jgi:hypothetical protein